MVSLIPLGAPFLIDFPFFIEINLVRVFKQIPYDHVDAFSGSRRLKPTRKLPDEASLILLFGSTSHGIAPPVLRRCAPPRPAIHLAPSGRLASGRFAEARTLDDGSNL